MALYLELKMLVYCISSNLLGGLGLVEMESNRTVLALYSTNRMLHVRSGIVQYRSFEVPFPPKFAK